MRKMMFAIKKMMVMISFRVRKKMVIMMMM